MNKEFVISISSGVYTRGGGGTNKVIKSHQQMLNQNGISYFYLCPVSNRIQKQLKLNTTGYWIAIIDGNIDKVYSTAEVVNIIKSLLDSGKNCLKLFIHHLKNVSIDSLDRLLECISVDILFYIHDYFTICNSCFLMKNDLSYCGTGHISPTKCQDCKYYKESVNNGAVISSFFADFEDRITFVAPSEAAMNIWLTAYPKYKNKACFISHQKLTQGEYKENLQVNAPLKIAFIGAANFEKGWLDFEKLVEKTHTVGTIEYYHLGVGGQELKNVHHISVDYHSELTAMVQCIRDNCITISLLWSLCPETYSYTYFEAFAGNSIIISNKNSGNIAYQIQKNCNGFVFKDIDQLIEFILDPDLVKKVKEFKKVMPLGPMQLEENDELVRLVKYSSNAKLIKVVPLPRGKVYQKILLFTEIICSKIKSRTKK